MVQIVLPFAMLMLAVSGAAEAAGDANKIQATEKLASLNENTRGDIDKAQRKFEYAVRAFWEFRHASDENAKKAYGAFKNEAEEFRKQAADARNKIAAAEKDATVYFAKWQQEDSLITDPKRRQRSERRRAAAQAAFQKHLDAFKTVENVFEPGVTLLLEQATLFKDDYSGRSGPAAEDAERRAQKMAEDAYWQIDNVFEKTELFR